MDGKVEDQNDTPRSLARRSFVTGTIASGFALAVQPISAETIITSTEGLDAGMVAITASDGKIPGYRARPAGTTTAPTVLVVQEIFGLHEHIKDICRRLAKLGYYAIAPDLYSRFGDASKVPDIATLMKDIVPKVPDAQVLADLDAAAAFAKAESAATQQLAITGFCWGGRIVWLYTAHNPDLKAAVAWYGPLRNGGPLQPKSPLDVVADLKAPVLGLYGGADPNIPIESIKQVEAAANAAHKKVEFVVYPDTPHAFNADYRPSYREGPAKDGWNRMQAWFKANGV